MKPQLNIQDSFLFSHLKSNTDIEVIPVVGEPFKGRVVRFDRYMVVFVSEGKTLPYYKQAIAAIVGMPAHPHPGR